MDIILTARHTYGDYIWRQKTPFRVTRYIYLDYPFIRPANYCSRDTVCVVVLCKACSGFEALRCQGFKASLLL